MGPAGEATVGHHRDGPDPLQESRQDSDERRVDRNLIDGDVVEDPIAEV